MRRPRRDNEAGITLIEVLVVLSVISVAAGATMIGLGDRNRSAGPEAMRLARQLSLGVDEALITGLPLSLHWDAKSYRFAQMPPGNASTSPKDWPAAAMPALAVRHDLAEPFELGFEDGRTADAIILPASGVAPVVTFRVDGGGDAWTVTFNGFSTIAQAQVAP